jgi:5-methylcytosine-specific restriction endonuclease McrA
LSALAVVVEKPCSRCGETKPLEQFSRQKLGKYGHRADCKACQRVYNTTWKHANQERTRATTRSHYEANREARLAYNRAWNVANRDRTRAALRRYRAAHPKRLAMAKALRRKLGANRQSAELALQRVALYGGRCYYCRAVADTIDHRIPISRGGTNLPANLVPACRSCNSRKRARTEREWKEVMQHHG